MFPTGAVNYLVAKSILSPPASPAKLGENARYLTDHEQHMIKNFLFPQAGYVLENGIKQFDLLPLLQQIKETILNDLEKVFMSSFHGGALSRILRGDETIPPDSDGDIYYLISQPGNPEALKNALLKLIEPLNTSGKKILCHLRISKKDPSRGSIQIILPCITNGLKRKIDIMVAWNPEDQCVFSSDAFHAHLPLHETTPPIVETLDGYPFQKSFAYLQRKEFFALPGKCARIREGLRFYLKELTRGNRPQDCSEEDLVQKFIKDDYKKESFLHDIHTYLNQHVNYNDRIIFILNFQNVIERHPWSLTKEQKIEILNKLSSAMGFATTEDARLFHMLLFWKLKKENQSALISDAPWEETERFKNLTSEEKKAFLQRIRRFLKDFQLEEIGQNLLQEIRAALETSGLLRQNSPKNPLYFSEQLLQNRFVKDPVLIRPFFQMCYPEVPFPTDDPAQFLRWVKSQGEPLSFSYWQLLSNWAKPSERPILKSLYPNDIPINQVISFYQNGSKNVQKILQEMYLAKVTPEHFPLIICMMKQGLSFDELRTLTENPLIQALPLSDPIKMLLLERENSFADFQDFYIASLNFKAFPKRSLFLWNQIPKPLPMTYMNFAEEGMELGILSPEDCWRSFLPMDTKTKAATIKMVKLAKLCLQKSGQPIAAIDQVILHVLTLEQIQTNLEFLSLVRDLSNLSPQKRPYHAPLLEIISKQPSSQKRTELFLKTYNDVRLSKDPVYFSSLSRFLLSIEKKHEPAPAIYKDFIINRLFGHPQLVSEAPIPGVFQLFDLCFQKLDDPNAKNILEAQLIHLLQICPPKECVEGLKWLRRWVLSKKEGEKDSSVFLPSQLQRIIDKIKPIPDEQLLSTTCETIGLLCPIPFLVMSKPLMDGLYEMLVSWISLRQKRASERLAEAEEWVIFCFLAIITKELVIRTREIEPEPVRKLWFLVLKDALSQRRSPFTAIQQDWIIVIDMLPFWGVLEISEFVSFLEKYQTLIPYNQTILCLNAIHRRLSKVFSETTFLEDKSIRDHLQKIHASSIAIYTCKTAKEFPEDFNEHTLCLTLHDHFDWIHGLYDEKTEHHLFDSTKVNATFFKIMRQMKIRPINYFIGMLRLTFPTSKPSLEQDDFLIHQLIKIIDTNSLQIQDKSDIIENFIRWMLQEKQEKMVHQWNQIIYLLTLIFSSGKALVTMEFILLLPSLIERIQQKLASLINSHPTQQDPIFANMAKLLFIILKLLSLAKDRKIDFPDAIEIEKYLDPLTNTLFSQLQVVAKLQKSENKTNSFELSKYISRIREYLKQIKETKELLNNKVTETLPKRSEPKSPVQPISLAELNTLLQTALTEDLVS
jgi:hypothetical protein